MLVATTPRQITLQDGRALSFAEYGNPRGEPILYFHGLPGSRLDAQLTEPVASRLGVRVIAVDRPGFGRSDFKPDRTIGEWPHDVTQLADALDLDRFAVMGVSGGGPYAAACAHKIPERLSSVGIICGMGPLEAPGAKDGMTRFCRACLFVSEHVPQLLRPFCALITRALGDTPHGFHLGGEASPLDRETLERAEINQILGDSFCEAVRDGARGAAWDLALLGRRWDFRLQDISTQVHLWHGELDDTVPLAMGRYQAAAIPNCEAHFYPGDGHFSLPVNRMEEILGTLLRRHGGERRANIAASR
jgi:pimeloyl-ACP methyl ester carboxylesterase